MGPNAVRTAQRLPIPLRLRNKGFLIEGKEYDTEFMDRDKESFDIFEIFRSASSAARRGMTQQNLVDVAGNAGLLQVSAASRGLAHVKLNGGAHGTSVHSSEVDQRFSHVCTCVRRDRRPGPPR